jgi:C-terminal processing protease CtpA/Prc
MNRSIVRIISAIAVLSLALAACRFSSSPAATPTLEAATPTPTPELELVESPLSALEGTFTVTNDYVIATYAVEHAVMLIDMTGFIQRDPEWELPVESQVLGPMDVDVENLSGKYTLALPALPQGELHDLDNDDGQDTGVQVFASEYAPNYYGDLFYKGDDRYRGWPTYLASVKTDPENEDEVTGGKLIIWAPDADQEFPTGFGDDGLLFTADDPAAPVPAGYSVVDLDTDPFTVGQPNTAGLTLYEPPDAALKDYSGDSYTEAFDKMFEKVRKEYAFNGIEGKPPDWDALYDELKPRVEKAEQDQDPAAFTRALRDFTWAFKDSHVGLGGDQYFQADFTEATAGGYGFAIRELDDGRVVVIFLTEPGPAQKAGIEQGAEITAFNGKPIKDAIGEVRPWTLPHSSDFALRYQQVRYLLRSTVGTDAEVTFTNPGGSSETTTLTSIAERESFDRTSVYYNVDTDYLLPVDSRIIKQDNAEIGYIKVNANYDDINLLIRLFERALQEFQARDVAGVIIDMRYNSGGAPLGLAGFLHDEEIPMGQSEYYSDKTGKFEPEGVPERVIPNENQYRFNKTVLLVEQTCFSACEFEAYGFGKVPGMIVVGEYPTAGAFGEVARGQFSLPEGLALQVPTGRTVLEDGSLLIEGQGVAPTLHVPIDETTVFRTDDVVLDYGIKAVLEPLGAGIAPASPPHVMSPDETQALVSSGSFNVFEDLARESYTTADLLKMDATFTYTVELSESQDVGWVWGWCAQDQAVLDDNLAKITLAFTLNGEDVPLEAFLPIDYDSGGQKCKAYVAGVTDWAGGEHHAVTTATFTQPLNDGTYDYSAGAQTFDYAIFVKP